MWFLKKLPESTRDEFCSKAKEQRGEDIHRRNTKPSHIFADVTGVQGIYVSWKLPDGLTADDMYLNASSENSYQLSKKIVELNPELKNIEFTEEQSIDFVKGVATGLNASDIDFYINRQGEAEKTKFKIWDKLEKQTGIRPGWVVSPETYKAITTDLGLI